MAAANQIYTYANDPRYYRFNNGWYMWRKDDSKTNGLKPMSDRLKNFEETRGVFFNTFIFNVSEDAKYDGLYAHLYQERILSEMKAFVNSFEFGKTIKVLFFDDLHKIQDSHEKIELLMDPMTLFLPPRYHFLPWSNEINDKNSATRIHEFSQTEFDRFTRLLEADKKTDRDVQKLTNILALHLGNEGEHCIVHHCVDEIPLNAFT